MRSISVWLVGGLLCGALIHCSGDDNAAPGGNNDGGGGGDGGTNDASGDGSSNDGKTSGIDVHGTVEIANPGAPIPNRDVVILGADDTVYKLKTAADGTFNASGVAAPYDIYVPYVSPDGGADNYPLYYAGLTRTDPVVRGETGFVPGTATARSAPIHYTYNACAGCKIWLSGPDDGFTETGTGASQAYTDGVYRWTGDASYSPHLHVLYQDATGAFTSYLDMGSVPLTDAVIEDFGTLSPGVSLATSPTLTVTSTVPGGYTYDATSVQFRHSDGALLAHVDSVTASSSARIPAQAGLIVDVYANAHGPNNSSDSAFVTFTDYSTVPASLSLAMTSAATLLTPANAATGVTSAQKLTWTSSASSTMFFVGMSTPAGFFLEVYTASTTIDLARLAKAGLVLPTGQTYTWRVTTGDASEPSVDEYTKPGGTAPVPTGTPAYSATSGSQTFTTQ